MGWGYIQIQILPGFIFPVTFTIYGLKCSCHFTQHYGGSLSPAADR